MASDIGNYFRNDTFCDLQINAETATPAALSRWIRSGMSQSKLLEAIEVAKVITNEHLCDALDRETFRTFPAVFRALIAKIEHISESSLTCAIYQWKEEELREMLGSGKLSVAPESLLPKIQSRKIMEVMVTVCPHLKAKVEADPKLQKLLRPVSPPPPPVVVKEDPDDYISWILTQQKKEESVTNSLRERAIKAAENRNFIEARLRAEAIPNKIYRRGTLADIATIYFRFGDIVAIESALDLARRAEDNRDGYICAFIDECGKLADKKLAEQMAMKAAQELKDPELMSSCLRKIGQFSLT